MYIIYFLYELIIIFFTLINNLYGYFYLGRVAEHTHEDGRIVYKYTGDKCKDDVDYQLHIIMMCDYGAIDSYPELFPYVSIPKVIFLFLKNIQIIKLTIFFILGTKLLFFFYYMANSFGMSTLSRAITAIN